jgi:hypothetical protein
MSIWKELRRRHVFKVVVAYAVIAWVLAQVASVVFPPLQLPSWSVTLVIALLILGFPVAVFLAWAFPAGERWLTAGRRSPTRSSSTTS